MFALNHQPLLFAHIVCLCPNPIFLSPHLLLPPIIFSFSTIYLSLFFTRNHNHLLLLHLTTFYIQFKELESTTMTGMEPIPTEVAGSRLSVANIVHDVFWAMFPSRSSLRDSNAASRGSQGLEDSRWAPKRVEQKHACHAPGGLEDSMWAPKGNSQKVSQPLLL